MIRSLQRKKKKINHRTDRKLVSGHLGQGNGYKCRREGLYHRGLGKLLEKMDGYITQYFVLIDLQVYTYTKMYYVVHIK